MEAADTRPAQRSPTVRTVAAVALLGAALLLVAGLFAFVSPRGGDNPGDAAGTGTNAATQKSEGGNVTVTVTWPGTAAGPVFDVALDTHSVDLDKINLGELAVLRVDGQEAAPLSWDAPKGGHHREGTLSFPATGADGAPLIGPNATTVELVIRGVAGVPERVFTWTP